MAKRSSRMKGRARKKTSGGKRTASASKRASTLAAIDDIMREEGIPAGGARFSDSKGKRTSKAGLVDKQGRMKTGSIVPRSAVGGGEAAAVGFSGGSFH